jgi:hypothetical protein
MYIDRKRINHRRKLMPDFVLDPPALDRAPEAKGDGACGQVLLDAKTSSASRAL